MIGAGVSVYDPSMAAERARSKVLNYLLPALAALVASACNPWQKQADNLQGIILHLLANGQKSKADFVAEFGPPASCAPRPTGELCQWKRHWGAAGSKKIADDIRVEFDLSGRYISGKAIVHRGTRIYRGHYSLRSSNSWL